MIKFNRIGKRGHVYEVRLRVDSKSVRSVKLATIVRRVLPQGVFWIVGVRDKNLFEAGSLSAARRCCKHLVLDAVECFLVAPYERND